MTETQFRKKQLLHARLQTLLLAVLAVILLVAALTAARSPDSGFSAL